MALSKLPCGRRFGPSVWAEAGEGKRQAKAIRVRQKREAAAADRDSARADKYSGSIKREMKIDFSHLTAIESALQ